MALMMGFRNVFTIPKISATTTSVSTFDSVVSPCTSMPGTRAVATASDTAVISTRISAFMRISWHAP
jgi:hypothetical protein